MILSTLKECLACCELDQEQVLPVIGLNRQQF